MLVIGAAPTYRCKFPRAKACAMKRSTNSTAVRVVVSGEMISRQAGCLGRITFRSASDRHGVLVLSRSRTDRRGAKLERLSVAHPVHLGVGFATTRRGVAYPVATLDRSSLSNLRRFHHHVRLGAPRASLAGSMRLRKDEPQQALSRMGTGRVVQVQAS